MNYTRIPSSHSFEQVVERLEAAINAHRFRPYDQIQSSDPEQFQRNLDDVIGPSDFMLFLAIRHGQWLAEVKSNQYVIGNPRIARTMLPGAPGIGQFVPTRIGVHQDLDGKVWVAFEEPVAQMAALTQDQELLARAQGLTDKLRALAEEAAQAG